MFPSKTFSVISKSDDCKFQRREPKEKNISCMKHDVPCQYQDGERFPQITKERTW